MNWFPWCIVCVHTCFAFGFFFFFWLLHAACRLLVPQSEIEPVLPALGAQSLSHWATWEVSKSHCPEVFFKTKKYRTLWMSCYNMYKNRGDNIFQGRMPLFWFTSEILLSPSQKTNLQNYFQKHFQKQVSFRV